MEMQRAVSTEIPNDIIFAMQERLELGRGGDEGAMDQETLIHRNNFDKLFGEGDMAMLEEVQEGRADSNVGRVDAGSLGRFESKMPGLSQHNPFGSILEKRPLITGTNLFGNFEKIKGEKTKIDMPEVGGDEFDWTFDVKNNFRYTFPKPSKGNKMSDWLKRDPAIGMIFFY